jgi:DHA2 family methylenomycin A resistance protein-like MFS transporter
VVPSGLVGQPLGGLLTPLDWRWVFTINLPLCASMVLFLVTVARSATRPAPFDWPGQVLAVSALAALVFGLIEGGHAGFARPAVVAALVVAVVSLSLSCGFRRAAGTR